ncbi:MAG: hypothetical protein ABIK83_10995 [Candidatus Zixiibacteriota bacterium]
MRYILMTIFSIILLAGCSGDGKPFFIEGRMSDYFPMQVGDTWYYTADGETMVVRRISDEIDLSGVNCMPVLTSLPPVVTDTLEECWGISETAFSLYLIAYRYYPDPPLIVPFNLTSDSPYMYDSFAKKDNNPNSGFRIKGTLSFEELVTRTVPAGTFKNCLKLRYDDGSEPYDEYYAPGVGLLDNGDIILDSAVVGGVKYGG